MANNTTVATGVAQEEEEELYIRQFASFGRTNKDETGAAARPPPATKKRQQQK